MMLKRHITGKALSPLLAMRSESGIILNRHRTNVALIINATLARKLAQIYAFMFATYE